jgi:hypothetical protein
MAKERQTLTSQLTELEQRKIGWVNGLEAGVRLIEMFHAEQARLESLTYEEKRALLTWLGVTVKLHPKASEQRWTLTTRISLPALVEYEFEPDDGGVEVDADMQRATRYRAGMVFGDDETYPKLVEHLKCLNTQNFIFPSLK